jgi:hypothetical protein
MTKRYFPLVAVLTLWACSDTAVPDSPAASTLSALGADGPTVLTRNIYLGADLNPVLGAPSPQVVPLIAAQVWAEVQATNFPARAGALADEIVRGRPHLIGLQEASLYRVQSPGDLALGGAVPATAVAYDFVALLLDSLAARGAEYVIAAQTNSFDVELPVYTGASPIPFDDVRLTDREVILARADVAFGNAQGGLFAARLNLTAGGAGGAPVSVTRGWASVDATIDGRSFRFLSTHLEVQSFAPIQVAQAAQLLSIASASSLPIVMLGDFNSAADGSQTPTYANIVQAGFTDVWHREGVPGYTCCHAADLLNDAPELNQRIDIVFVRGFDPSGLGSVGARVQVTGDQPRDRLPSGLWPSDHAGVLATLRLPPSGTLTH